jgi:tetratricopeptide (TPR) repeat protein
MSELELLNELGNVYFKTGAWNEAIRTYQKVIELDPDCVSVYINLASIYDSQGRYADVIPIIKKEIEIVSDVTGQASLWNQLGETYRKLEDYANASACFWKAIELNPQEPSFQSNLTEAELASRAPKPEAKAEFDQIALTPATLDGTPDTEETPNPEPENKSLVFVDDQKTSSDDDSKISDETRPIILGGRSLDMEEEITPIEPPEALVSADASIHGLLRLGFLRWRNGEPARALRFLNIALDKAHRCLDQYQEALAYYIIAQVDTGLGNIEDAIRAYQSSANLAPERFFPWNKLGDLNCVLNRFEDAQAAFQEAVEHNPKDSVSWNGLGDVYHKTGRYEDAIAAYQLGNVFEKQLSEEDPLREFEKAIEADQENPQAWNEAGNIYFDTGAFEDAIASYQKAIQFDLSNSVYKANLAKAVLASEGSISTDEPAIAESRGEINSENLPHCQPFILEPASQETEQQTMTELDLAVTGETSDTELTPGAGYGLADGDSDPEPEASYWVFKSEPQHRKVQQPVRQYLPQIVEIGLDNAHPQPAFGSKAPQGRAFSCDEVLTDTFHENASILVQLTPRALKPTETEARVDLQGAQEEQESTFVRSAPAVLNSGSVSGENQNGEFAPLPNATSNPPADQASLDLQILENDISAYRRVTEINPQNDRAWDTLGNMYENIGLHAQAIASFEQAIALAPQKEVYHYHLGIALAYQMQFNQAIQALEKVIALNPRYMLAHCALAGYYRRMGRETEAREHAQIARSSMEYENEYNQACFESICGDTDRAISLLEIALEKKQIQPGMVRSDPDLDFIRKDARFEALLSKNQITS